MISYYSERIYVLKNATDYSIIKMLNGYDGRHRSGDRYIRNLFECALIYYIDKFGNVELDRVIEKLFIWAYKLRLKLQSVRLASVDNRAIETNIFKVIKDANTHHEVLNIPVAGINKINFDVAEIENEFRKLGYYNEQK